VRPTADEHAAVRARRHAWLRDVLEDMLARLDPAARTEAALAELDWRAPKVVLVAAGKAAPAMTAGALRYLERRGLALTGGVVIGLETAAAHVPPPLRWCPASHPVPDQRSVHAAEAALAAVRAAAGFSGSEGAEILALISGGTSALMALPAPGIALADKVATVRAVAASGADIHALNTVRKHLSAIKGGQLAARAAAPVTTLVASDVIGDDLAAVGSGPTVPDPTTFAQARAIVAAAMDWAAVPASVRAHLDAGCAGQRLGGTLGTLPETTPETTLGTTPETPKAARPHDRAVLVAGTAALLHAAGDACRGRGARVEIADRALAGDVAHVAARIARAALQAEARAKLAGSATGQGSAHSVRQAWIAGGEATIVLPRQPGVGGRAQHMALLLARALAGTRHVSVLVAGSDGIDGNSPAAGAIVDGHTWDAMRAAAAGEPAGRDPGDALARCDAFPALAAVGAAICTGPTGVNHADIAVVAAG
jgi:glycerate 2-kinase